MKMHLFSLVLLLTFTAAAFGDPTVNSPANGATVDSTFTLSASSATCSSQSVSAMAYSIDYGSDLAVVHSQSMNVQAQSAAGWHTLHVKAWGNEGAVCVTDVGVNVSSYSGGGSPVVYSPSNGATVNSQFTVAAGGSTCSSQPVSAMAYSIDSGGDQATVYDQSISVQAYAGGGGHTVHVKSWGNQGASCATDVNVNVAGSGGSSSGPYIPSYAESVSNLQVMGNWTEAHDVGGWTSGKMALVSWPAHNGTARQITTNYSNAGGERYWVSFSDNESAKNFVYDAWVYLNDSAGSIANLEMDVNQVMPNGQTAIFGFQCDGYTSTWDYTKNAGNPWSPNDQWVHSGASCNPRNWSRNAWHHVQISFSRNDYGVVTYQAVYLDGAQSNINASVPSAFALGWGQSMVTNLQVDGLGSGGSPTVYVDNVTVYRW